MPNNNRVVLVTGAAGGLGLAIAARFHAHGDHVALLDLDAKTLDAAAATLPGSLAVSGDVTDEESIEAAMDKIAATFGNAPDVLVNNAGIVRFGDLLDHSVADFRRVIDVNLVGAFVVAKSAAKRMVARKCGAIVNITSLNAVAPSPDAGAYPAAKAGLALLTQHLALSLGPRGIRVNAVGPGFIDAGMSEQIYRDDAVRDLRSRTVPARSLGTAEDVANAVFFLASPEARYVHGQHLMVDGGVSFSLKLQMPRPAPKPRV
jgi:NAD(P)-dependent dehydrogenase (short-subunit alcohol dehydrogenase family)